MTKTNAPSSSCEQELECLEKSCAALRQRIGKLDATTARDVYTLISDIRVYLRTSDRTDDNDEFAACCLEDLCSAFYERYDEVLH